MLTFQLISRQTITIYICYIPLFSLSIYIYTIHLLLSWYFIGFVAFRSLTIASIIIHNRISIVYLFSIFNEYVIVNSKFALFPLSHNDKSLHFNISGMHLFHVQNDFILYQRWINCEKIEYFINIISNSFSDDDIW